MKVEKKEIIIGELAAGYSNDNNGNVVGYNGQLDIRPHYQRESVYDRKKQDLVIESVVNDRPISLMYWAVRDDGGYEILDGQQRTIAICEYIVGNNSYEEDYFDMENPNTKEKKILKYPLTVYICDGDFDDKMKWFETVNIAGVPLKPQEIRNAVYAGRWVSDARRWFSKRNCFAYRDGNKYMAGSCERQDYLEQAIKWHIESNDDKEIRQFMADNAKRIKDASETPDPAKHLYEYFKAVMDWVKTTFPDYHKVMKGLDWGRLYNTYKDKSVDVTDFSRRIKVLRADEDVRVAGIYEYLLSDDIRYINVRAFDEKLRRRMYKEQGGVCAFSGKGCMAEADKEWKLEEMEADHINPWSEGGPTNEKNCQMLCKDCNRRKGNT